MIFLGVGSNLGERWTAISQAWQELERAGVHVECSSPIYETLPWGYLDQPPYLNAVWRVNTSLPPI
ncbi:MAG: 2-amino-4-hydroxy-6-hydroxymethyldihydropteridine diphosphokinase, partial [Bacteroidia bacterium]|nr:2-amino-4-hydroxy-6-hydroxymethyldihydropteridine diphosphokinase [Bacteroidia bacterium]